MKLGLGNTLANPSAAIGGAFSPSDLSSYVGEWDAENFSTPTLSDSSGNGNDLTVVVAAGTAQKSPNGRAVLDFGAFGEYFRNDTPSTVFPDGNEDRTLAFCGKFLPGGSFSEFAGIAYGNELGNQAFGLIQDTDETMLIQHYGAKDHDTGVAMPDDEWHTFFITVNSGTSQLYVDNVATGPSDAEAFATVLDLMVVGRDIDDNRGLVTHFGTLLLFNEGLGAADRTNLHTYLDDRWISGSVGGDPDPEPICWFTHNVYWGSQNIAWQF